MPPHDPLYNGFKWPDRLAGFEYAVCGAARILLPPTLLSTNNIRLNFGGVVALVVPSSSLCRRRCRGSVGVVIVPPCLDRQRRGAALVGLEMCINCLMGYSMGLAKMIIIIVGSVVRYPPSARMSVYHFVLLLHKVKRVRRSMGRDICGGEHD